MTRIAMSGAAEPPRRAFGAGVPAAEACARAVLKAPILVYQWTFRPLVGWRCRHLPTCSDYAIEAIDRNGALKGFWLTVSRLSRCHPLGTSGYDPVPDLTAEHRPLLLSFRYGRWARVCHNDLTNSDGMSKTATIPVDSAKPVVLDLADKPRATSRPRNETVGDFLMATTKDTSARPAADVTSPGNLLKWIAIALLAGAAVYAYQGKTASDRRLTEIEGEKIALQRAADDAAAARDSAQKEIERLKAAETDALRLVEQSKTDITTATAKASELEGRIGALNGEIEKLKADLASAGANAAKLTADLDAANAAKLAAEGAATQLRADVDRLKGELAAAVKAAADAKAAASAPAPAPTPAPATP